MTIKMNLVQREALSLLKTIINSHMPDSYGEIPVIVYWSGEPIQEYEDKGYHHYRHEDVWRLLAMDWNVYQLLKYRSDGSVQRDYPEDYPLEYAFDASMGSIKVKEALEIIRQYSEYEIRFKDQQANYKGKIIDFPQSEQQYLLFKYLVEKEGQLVSKKELFLHVKPEWEREYLAREVANNIEGFHDALKELVKEINKKLKKCGLDNDIIIHSHDSCYVLFRPIKEI